MDLTRRQLLAAGGAELGLIGAARAVDNVFLGYDRFTGTNLRRQNLDPLVDANLRPSGRRVAALEGYRIEYREDAVTVVDAEEDPTDGTALAAFDPAMADPEDAARIDAEYGLDGALSRLVADLGALAAGDVRFSYHGYREFFDRLGDADVRPETVSALRGRRRADPETVESFADADPRDPLAVAEGLVEGFRERTYYDVPRYAAGSVEDNVIFGAADLRAHFESPTGFEALADGENAGLFCYELTRRSVEALQAVPARDQGPPVFAGYVKDDRHKHVYTIVASAVRDGDDGADDDGAGIGDLVIPVTFLDYTHSTLYDDLRMRRILGEGLDAYDDRHRATSVDWYR